MTVPHQLKAGQHFAEFVCKLNVGTGDPHLVAVVFLKTSIDHLSEGIVVSHLWFSALTRFINHIKLVFWIHRSRWSTELWLYCGRLGAMCNRCLLCQVDHFVSEGRYQNGKLYWWQNGYYALWGSLVTSFRVKGFDSMTRKPAAVDTTSTGSFDRSDSTVCGATPILSWFGASVTLHMWCPAT